MHLARPLYLTVAALLLGSILVIVFADETDGQWESYKERCSNLAEIHSKFHALAQDSDYRTDYEDAAAELEKKLRVADDVDMADPFFMQFRVTVAYRYKFRTSEQAMTRIESECLAAAIERMAEMDWTMD